MADISSTILSNPFLKEYVVLWFKFHLSLYTELNKQNKSVRRFYPNRPLMLTFRIWGKMAAIFVEDIFKCIFLNEKKRISFNNSPKFVPKGPFNNIPPLV